MKKIGLFMALSFAAATLTACPGKTYEITWKNWDDSVLRVDSVKAGSVPTYDGIPTRAEDERFTYTFKTWSPDLVEATENATYVAVYSKTEKETKEAWTNEEKALMGEYIAFELPFYKAEFQVYENFNEDCLIAASQRKCTEEDIENYCELLEDAGFIANVESPNFDFSVLYYDFDVLYRFERRLTNETGEPLSDVQIVNFGLDEDSALVIYSTMVLNFFGEEGLGNQIMYNYNAQYKQDMVDYYTTFCFEILSDIYETENKYVKPFYYADTEHGFGFIEVTAMYPWAQGNLNGDLFPQYQFIMTHASEEDWQSTIDAITAAGYQDLERKEGDKSYLFMLADGDKGDFCIEVSDMSEVKLADGSSLPCYSIIYGYLEAEVVE